MRTVSTWTYDAERWGDKTLPNWESKACLQQENLQTEYINGDEMKRNAMHIYNH